MTIVAEGGRDVTISDITFIQQLETSASKFGGKISAFVAEYLSPEGAPGAVPFGGRSVELAKLDAWLDAPTATKVLLSAPAGRGKSALLVHWLARLQRQNKVALADGADGAQKWNLAFIPISIRRGTNRPTIFYQAMCARIAEIMDLDVKAPVDQVGDFYHDLASELLSQANARNVRILLVVDGLDEALGLTFDGSIFPTASKSSLRIVVAARWIEGDVDCGGWLSRLDWEGGTNIECLELPPLSKQAIAELLQDQGNALRSLPRRSDLMEKLVELTGGEPLLVRYYIEDLSRDGKNPSRLTPEDLNGLKPGFNSYFKNWLQWQSRSWDAERKSGAEINENTLNRVLAVLACAYGPLPQDHLAGLSERIHGVDVGPSMEWLLRPLGRFLMGVGDDGYVLNHPKIARFLRDERFRASEIGKTLKGFVDWGADVVSALRDGNLAPKDTPWYLLQFYLQHLDEVHAPWEAYESIVSEGWLRAWEQRDESYRSFAEAVRHALQRTVTRTGRCEEKLSFIVRCVLCLCSVRSSGIQIPPNLLVAAASRGLISSLSAITLSDYSLRVIVGVSDGLSEVDRNDFLQEAFDRLRRKTKDPRDEADTISKMAEFLPEHLAAQALEFLGPSEAADRDLAASIWDPPRDRARTTAESDIFYRSVTAAERRLETWSDRRRTARAVALGALAPRLPAALREGAIREAVGIAEVLLTEQRLDIGAQVVAPIVDKLPQPEKGNLVLAALDRIEARRVASETTRSVWYLCGSFLQESAERALSLVLTAGKNDFSTESYVTTGRTLLSIAERLETRKRAIAIAKAQEKFLAALDLIRVDLADSTELFNAALGLSELAYNLPDLESNEIAKNSLELALRVSPKSGRCRCLGLIAPKLPAHLRTIAEGAFREGLEALSSAHEVSQVVDDVADSLSDSCVMDLLAQGRRRGDEKERTSALTALTAFLPSSGRGEVLADALSAARTERYPKQRAQALAQIASTMISGPQQDAVLSEAVNALCLTEANYDRLEALEAFSSLLKGELLERAAQAAREIAADFELSRALPLLMKNADSALREVLLRDALRIEDGGVRGRAMRAMAPFTPKALWPEMLAAARRLQRQAMELEAFGRLSLDEQFRQAHLGKAPQHPHWSDHGMLEAAVDILRALKDFGVDMTSEERDLVSNSETASAHKNWLKSELVLSIDQAGTALAHILSDPDNDEQDRIRELCYLLPKLPRERITDALDAAYKTGGPTLMRALRLLAERISEASDPALIAKLLIKADQLTRREFYELLTYLYPGLQSAGSPGTLAEVKIAITDTAAWFP